MNILSVESLTKSFGERIILKEITFGIDQGDKVAFIAKNGAGKTTLLKILCGIDVPDSGRIVFPNGIRVEYLEQFENFTDGLTVLEAVLEAKTPAADAIRKYALATADAGESSKFDEAVEAMSNTGAWDYEVKISTILSQLKIDNKYQLVSELSGGQRKRVALAKLLISEPDVMILDEPTNHLDLDMIEWLEEFLTRTTSTVLMVTHDRYFLEVICTTIFELADLTLYKYPGNFSYYLEKKAEREEILLATVSKARNTMRTELEWIRRQPKARGTKQKARIDAFEGIKTVAQQKIEKDEMEIQIQMERLGTKIVEFHKVGKSFGDKMLIRDLSYFFKRGEKIGIVGANGTGKSTLLNLIAGLDAPSKGKIVLGDTVRIAYYTQTGIPIKDDKKVIEVVRDIAEFIPLTKGRKMMASQLLETFLFPKDMHYNFVSKLSGGEKKRLYLLTILMNNPNFLLLDEPTNDLDIFTLSVLEDYLMRFEGCLVIVSHDRYFMDKMVDHTFYFEGDGVISDIQGNYTKWREALKERQKQLRSSTAYVQTQKVDSPTTSSEKKTAKLSFKENKEFQELAEEIKQLETEREALTEKLNSGTMSSDEANAAATRLGTIATLIDSKELRWLELAERAEN